ncbi:MAG TPA: TlpA disulfide reductase family protein [Chitinophagaceae bacterium]|nr:TlpA disulfide reductase family protein [Chitinophagaceae bacterium]
MRGIVVALLVSVAMPVAVFCQVTATPGFIINGKINSIPDNSLVILSGFSGTDTLAKAKVIKGSFVLKGKVSSPDVHILTFPSMQRRLVLFMGNDHVNIKGDSADFSDIEITGAPVNYDYNEFIYHIKPLNDYVQYYRNLVQTAQNKDSVITILNAVYNIYQQSIDQFLARKSKSPVAALVLAYSYDTDPNKNVTLLEKRYGQLGGDALTSQFAKNIQQVLAVDKIGAVGTKAIDFTQNDTTGKPVSLSQFRGKYVLVDFWASWCRPCRAENPNVVAAYNEYKDKNFTILSVSLDQRKENWVYAINMDHLAWNHVSDLQYWNNTVARTYHIESIPANFLVDPDGNIIAKDLRGEELASKLQQILK